ncbi:hypothetical protein AAEO56_17565 [Flavobacterium sp. DGU11]|uniref:Uncharacterized protein n=1 Tax=Flavobacterium arundinis TaxID=3139143 RepID=A0ABU9I1J1_9FLAO
MIKNTLFRFISMRAPEHLEKKEVDLRFVRHPDTSHANNYFLTLINAASDKTKRHVINTAATDFSVSAWQSREDVKNTVPPELYDFAIWLSSNRSTFTLEELDEFLAIDPILNTSVLLQLWDNLFYQIITFKSGYVREAILSVLVADHFLKNKSYVDGLKELRKLAQARVIIPKESFGTIRVPSRELILQKKLDSLPVSTLHLDLSARRALAVSRIADLEKVAKELKLAQADFNKRNDREFALAKRIHDDAVKDAYDNASVEIQTYIDKDTGLTKTVKSYPDLKLPKFTFHPAHQFEDVYIKKQMSDDSYNILISIKEKSGVSSFSEAIELIEQSIEEETATAYNGASHRIATSAYQQPGLSQQVPTVNYDIDNPGDNSSPEPATIPQLGSPITNPPVFNINSSGIMPDKSSLLMVIGGMPVTGIEVLSADSTVTLANGTVITRHNDFAYEWVGSNLHATIFKDNKISTTQPQTITLEGSLTLRNGASISFSGDCHTENDTSTIGIAQQRKVYKGDGTFTYTPMKVTDEDGNDIPPRNSVIDYKPSGFGVKRLGIADYRKVEQEVCCYVPGEVSNIENVMAREYKEKSTRRLRRSEDTTTTSKEQEKEKLTDTTSTDRFEMNREVSNLLAEDTSMGLHTSASYDPTPKSQLNIGADFAHNTTKEHSDNQAITQAKEVTERALERVVQKVKEERIVKIIEEYEETNKHGYDNREGNQHISGVYRWVDKIYNNKVVNYGKRLMYEFMIPEPAAFHNFAIKAKDIDLPIRPIDPRTGDGHVSMATHSVIDRTNYTFWAAMYNAEVTPCPDQYKYIGKSFAEAVTAPAGQPNEMYKESVDIDVPEGYFTLSFTADYTLKDDATGNISAGLSVGNYHTKLPYIQTNSSPATVHYPIAEKGISPYYDKIHVACSSFNYQLTAVTVSIKTELSNEAFAKWQMETFNAIIAAYEKRKAEYDEQVKELKAAIGQKVATNPLFYREIENISLKKNCIAYLADHSNMGLNMLTARLSDDVNAVYKEARLEKYAAFVKFFEQAFEWDLMSYNFYPFYWAKQDLWKDLYNIDNDDPLFRSFLQSGMARVVLTVRPGFEETVNWYMGTGQIWNGGQVTTLDDPLYLSIVEEMKDLEGTVEETWESRVPTSLTVLQAGTIGLDVTGLPCNPECDEYKVLDKDGNTIPNPISQKNFQIGKSYDDNGEELPEKPGEPPLEGDDPKPSV